MRAGLTVLVLANFVLTGAGLLLPFAAASPDSSAPWAAEVFRFNLATCGATSLLVLSAYVFGVFTYERGRGARVLAAASFGSLMLPAATSAAYLWYLRNIAEGTIGGAVGFQLVLLSGGLAVLALVEGVLLFVFRRAVRPVRHLRAARATVSLPTRG